jgi:hypothetical protein
VLTFCLHQRLHPIYHPPYHIINLALVECLLGLLRVPHLVEFRVVLNNPVLHHMLDVLDWVHIWRVGGPFHHYYTLIFEPFSDFLSCMDGGVILHEDHPGFIDCRKSGRRELE